ncbi:MULTISPECIES: MFS transporter [Sphingobacterium]|uniref:MFS transporter n=1 Tax=Sphingobacterium TaxID=28453 RepID=UPI00104AB3C0|nr:MULTISPECIES: MFS transporter [Sphingobacterium]MCW2259740.1 putative MFS family arabinose efflux permease [Sphingobacterium kitahiroshimense]TCR03420.1 putative MFS family arabinose efflux permease [Sphingobacterium sp. JUb78]
MKTKQQVPLTGYQKFVIFILAITQFTVILDFMVMSPLGDMLMKSLSLSPSGFGAAVSGYAISAGISGLLTAGFADRFDRKKMLQFFYYGFIVGTIFCALSESYEMLLAARIITGLFGGVIGSISMSIITDIFPIQKRGQVMSYVQMSFGASQVLGVPIGIYIATLWQWEAPFWMVAGLSILIAIAISLYLKPINSHLVLKNVSSPFRHLIKTISKRDYRTAFTSTALLAIGGFMMMPFGSVFAVNNLGVSYEQLTMMLMVSGLSSLIIMPFIGKWSDKIDKFKIFVTASIWMMVICVVYTNLSRTPLPLVIVLNIVLMIGIISRTIPSSALTSNIPDMNDRGAFMSINSSLNQIAGGVASIVASKIVTQESQGTPLQHYNVIGYIVVVITLISIGSMWRVNRLAAQRARMKQPDVMLPGQMSI